MSILLLSHIVFMSLSVLVTIGTVVASVLGARIFSYLRFFNKGVTAIGLTCGVILLLDAPLNVRCVLLTAYLVGFIALDAFIAHRNERLASVNS